MLKVPAQQHSGLDTFGIHHCQGQEGKIKLLDVTVRLAMNRTLTIGAHAAQSVTHNLSTDAAPHCYV